MTTAAATWTNHIDATASVQIVPDISTLTDNPHTYMTRDVMTSTAGRHDITCYASRHRMTTHTTGGRLSAIVTALLDGDI